MSVISKMTAKVQEVGLRNTIVGTIRRMYFKRLQKQEGFDAWHITPYELRGYLQATAGYINAHHAVRVVDIGCGLGELERHLRTPEVIGMDLSEEVIRTARWLNPSRTFLVGSFDEYDIPEPVDYLVTLGFMHGGDESMWQAPYRSLLTSFPQIRAVIVDTVPDAPDGSHHLDFTKILPEDFLLKDRLGPFLNGRFIEIYERVS